MSFFSKSSGILGMNARNLLYLYRYNSQANKRLADDKLYTKRFLGARGVGVAKLYASIPSLPALRTFNPNSLPRSFVIKPNRGYGGEGIMPIKAVKDGRYVDLNGDRYSWTDLYQHCIAILDGKFAVSGLFDQVLIEELLQPNEYFNKFIEYGLPDIRIIVFKYVPIMAMLRLPTAESGGKANLHLGAIGLGIDIGTGKTTYGVQHNRFIRKLPNGQPVSSLVIPQWDEVLALAAKTQAATQIGYLATDVALTATGIKILELNARAGLAIQISNQAQLRRRLEKVADLKVVSPAEGVRIGKTLFTRVVKKETGKEAKATKPIIGLFEYVTLITAPGGLVLAKIDPHSEVSYADVSLKLPPGEKLLSIKLKDQKLKVPISRKRMKGMSYRLVLAGKHCTDFLIDATKTVPEYRAAALAETPEEKIMQNIDAKIAAISEQLVVLGRMKPQNLEEEQERFLKKSTVSPQFTYRQPDLDTGALRNELKKIPRLVNHPLMPLYARKIEEINDKLSLIDHIGTPAVLEDAARLYGSVSDVLYQHAISFIKEQSSRPDTSKRIKIDEVVKRVTAFLADKHLSKWKVKVLESATSGMQVNKKNAVLINKKSRFTENRLAALLTHEIETHVYRLENGRLQKYRLFEQGTPGYLTTEEGLAIYNQNQIGVPFGNKFYVPAINVIAIYQGARLPFVELFHYLINTFGLEPEKAWGVCLRVKRGLHDTGQPGSFTKDRAYFAGYRLIQQFVKDKGVDALRRLYIGKIGIADLKYLGDVRQWTVRYLPSRLAVPVPDATRRAAPSA